MGFCPDLWEKPHLSARLGSPGKRQRRNDTRGRKIIRRENDVHEAMGKKNNYSSEAGWGYAFSLFCSKVSNISSDNTSVDKNNFSRKVR